MEDFAKLIEELELEKEKIKPIDESQGLIAYRKYLWALKFIEEKIYRLKMYKQDVVKSIDESIETQLNNIDRIRGEIERAVIADPIADKTKTGGRTLSLPDIATVSLSKLNDKIEIVNPELVLNDLGDEFKKVKISLDTTKAKNHIKKTGILPEGATKSQARTLSIRFKR